VDSLSQTGSEYQGLIDALLDRSARWDERDDAAMDLGRFDKPQVPSSMLVRMRAKTRACLRPSASPSEKS
jgi:hypothetical protein